MTPTKLDHSIDGIEEYDNPLPAWWLAGFYLCIAFAVVYCIIYPSFWFWNGTNGWTQEEQYRQELAAAAARYPKPSLEDQAARVPALAADPSTVAAGQGIFAKNCVVCHGDKGQGKIGPSLVDTEWRYGGEPVDLLTTVLDGRPKGMPPWKKILGDKKCLEVTTFVYSLRQQPQAAR